MEHLNGQVAVITGASRGIGEATARLFAAHGAKVVLLARSASDIDRIATEIGENAIAFPCDVAQYAALSDAMEKAVSTFGRLDILINNSGVIEPVSRIADADPDAWSATIDVNLKGVFYGMRAAVGQMVAQGGGTVLTVSSGAAHNPVEGWSHYCSAKAGAAMLTRMLDLEERNHGIRAIGLSPGTVATQMQKEIKASGVNPVSKLEWSDHIPPEWPTQALAWMCSADADGFLGEEISLRDDSIRRRLGLIA